MDSKGNADVVQGNPQPSSVKGELMGIPAHFTRFLCMACTCQNCDWPACFGAKASGTVLCFEGSGVCWKCIHDPRACFICWSGSSELVIPRTCCKMYEQFFCMECFCAIPSVEDGYKNTPATGITVPDHDGSRNLGDVVICSGLCCIIDSCHCRFPACLSCYEKRICLCLEDECIAVKPMCCEVREKEDLLCILLKGHQSIVMPTTCCKLVSQTFFWDRRMALPCDDDVPCVYTYFPCCTCCVNGQCSIACCTTINQATARNRTGPGGNGQYVNAQTVSPQVQVVTAQPI